jgi:hypothetical protein
MKDLTVDTEGSPVSNLNLIIITLLAPVVISKATKNPNVGLADVSTRHFYLSLARLVTEFLMDSAG